MWVTGVNVGDGRLGVGLTLFALMMNASMRACMLSYSLAVLGW